MKKKLLGFLCLVLTVALCACGAPAKTLEEVIPQEDLEALETSLNRGLTAGDPESQMEIDLSISGNTVTYDYRFPYNEITKEDFAAELEPMFSEAFASDAATFEQVLEEVDADGLGVVTIAINISNAGGELLYTNSTETREF